MATSKLSSVSFWEEFLNCSMCMDDFKDPRALDCLHTFCLDCLEQYIQSTSTVPGGKFNCPLCRATALLPRTGVQGIRKNHFIVSLQDAAKKDSSTDPHPCRGCEEDATSVKFCLECAHGLCQECCDAHRRLRAFKQHRLVTFEDLQGGKYSEDCKMMASLCEEHLMQKDLFCEEQACRKSICMKCKILKHEGHRGNTLFDRANDDRDILEKLCTNIEDNYFKESKHREQGQLVKTEFLKSCEYRKQEIKKKVQLAVATVKKEGEAVILEIDKAVKEPMDSIDAQLLQMESRLTQHEHIKEFICELLKHSTNEDLVHVSSLAMDQARQLLKTSASPMDWGNCKVPWLQQGCVEPQRLMKVIEYLDGTQLVLEKNVWRLLKAHHSAEVSTTCILDSGQQIKYKFETNNRHWWISLEGSGDGPIIAKEAIEEQLVKKVQYEKHVNRKPGLFRIMTEGSGKEWVQVVEGRYRCCIEVEQMTPSGDVDGATASLPRYEAPSFRHASFEKRQQATSQQVIGSAGYYEPVDLDDNIPKYPSTVFHINAIKATDIQSAWEDLNNKLSTNFFMTSFQNEMMWVLSGREVGQINSLAGPNLIIFVDKKRGQVNLAGEKGSVMKGLGKVESIILPNGGVRAEGLETLRSHDYEIFLKKLAEDDIRTPSYWTTVEQGRLQEAILKLSSSKKKKQPRVPVDSEVKQALEQLVKKSWAEDKVGVGRDAANLKHKNIEIITVERVENANLYLDYAHARKGMIGQHIARRTFPPVESLTNQEAVWSKQYKLKELDKLVIPEVNECWLFHGSSPEKIAAITKNGLDFRIGNKGMFGKGVYFAESSTKADQYADNKKGRVDGEHYMFIVRVLLGHVYVTDGPTNDYQRAPCMQCSNPLCKQHDDFYDSVIGEKADGGRKLLFREFIVYDKSRCYPEFLVTYVRK